MIESDAGIASAREDLCRFLAACYYEPSEAFNEERLFDSMVTAAECGCPELAESVHKLREAFFAQDLQTLLIDYTKLFLGPVQALAAPYGSRWLSGDDKLMQDSTMAVLDIYEDGGFDIGDDFTDLPDHVAVELEFLYLLMFNKNEAQGRGHRDQLLTAQALERRFLGEHLGAWIGGFSEAVKAGAGTAFYRELADLTLRFVMRETASLPGN